MSCESGRGTVHDMDYMIWKYGVWGPRSCSLVDPYVEVYVYILDEMRASIFNKQHGTRHCFIHHRSSVRTDHSCLSSTQPRGPSLVERTVKDIVETTQRCCNIVEQHGWLNQPISRCFLHPCIAVPSQIP